MCFVNDDQVKCAEITRFFIHTLNSGNDYRLEFRLYLQGLPEKAGKRSKGGKSKCVKYLY